MENVRAFVTLSTVVLTTCGRTVGLTVLGLSLTAAGGTIRENLPDGTRVAFTLKPTPKSKIRCEMFLPPVEKWDGRLWGFGNGGWAGTVQLRRCGTSATVMTDMGTSEYPQTRNDVPQEIRDDFGWRATHLMTVEAKRIVKEHYGRAPHHAYFSGASTGGGQGFCEAQRYPEDYDGIYAGVPAFDRVSLATPEVQRERLKRKFGTWFTPAEEDAVYAAEIAYFAKTDPEPARGRFILEPRVTREKLDGCWAEIVRRNPALADRERPWRALFEPVFVHGRRLAPGAQLGCEFRGASDFLICKLPQVGSKPYSAITDDDLCAFAADTTHNFKDIAAMKRYFRRGGRMLIDSALEDTSVPERAITAFIDELGPDDGYLYFRIPGRTHSGSPDTPHRGRLSKAGWIADVPRLLQDWVEKGVKPQTVTVPLHGCSTKSLVLKPYAR